MAAWRRHGTELAWWKPLLNTDASCMYLPVACMTQWGYSCSLYHKAHDNYGRMKGVSCNTLVIGVLLVLWWHRILNIESQSYNPASHLRLFQSHHTYALRINIHAQMMVSTDKPSHTEVQTGTETPRLENLTIYFMQVFQKTHLAGCQTPWAAGGGGERTKESAWQLLLTEIRGEREWNQIGNEMTGFSIWQRCFASCWPDCHTFITHWSQHSTSVGPFLTDTGEAIFLGSRCPRSSLQTVMLWMTLGLQVCLSSSSSHWVPLWGGHLPSSYFLLSFHLLCSGT